MLEYQAFNRPVFDKVPAQASAILDLGCGTGSMGKALMEARPGRKITGITFSQEEAIEARKIYDTVYVHDLNDLSLQLDQQFDVIICSHVLEHTMFPVQVLKHYAQYLAKEAMVIVALPNVLFFKQRLQFLKGHFKYNPNGGLMDSTHYRFFDFETSKELMTGAGMELLSCQGFGAFPQPLLRRIFPRVASVVDLKACRLFPSLFSFQYVLVGKKQLI